MADNIYDTTPGSAVADQLQNILARKRMEARQSMLDQLNQQNIESEMNFRQMQAQGLQDYHEARAEEQRAIGDERKAKTQRIADYGKRLDDYMATPDFQSLPTQNKLAIQLARISQDPASMLKVIGDVGKNPAPEGGDIFDIGRDGTPFDTGVWMPKGATLRQVPPPERPASLIPFVGTDPNDPTKQRFYGYDPKTNTYRPSTVPPPPTDPGFTGPRDPNQPSVVDLRRPGQKDTNTPAKTPVSFYDQNAFKSFNSTKLSKSPDAASAGAAALNNLIETIKIPNDKDGSLTKAVQQNVRGILSNPVTKSMRVGTILSKNLLDGSPEEVDYTTRFLQDTRGF